MYFFKVEIRFVAKLGTEMEIFQRATTMYHEDDVVLRWHVMSPELIKGIISFDFPSSLVDNKCLACKHKPEN